MHIDFLLENCWPQIEKENKEEDLAIEMEGYRAQHILAICLAMLQLSNHILIVSCTAADSDYVKSSCGATRYPDLCYETLQKHAPEIKCSPRALALTSLTVTLGLIKQSQVSLRRLMNQTKTSSSAGNQVMGDCLKQLKSAQGHLKDSKIEFESITDPANSILKVSSVQTWVSAAMTNQNTCTDGFDDHNLTGQVESATATSVKKVERLTSISLHFINKYAGRN